MEIENGNDLTRPKKSRPVQKNDTEMVPKIETQAPEKKLSGRQKPRTQKQLEAFKACSETRLKNIQKNKEMKMIEKARNVLQKFNQIPEEPKTTQPPVPDVPTVSTENVVPKTPAKKKEPKPTIHYNTESDPDSESQSESESDVSVEEVKPVKKQKAKPTKSSKSTSSKKKKIIIIESDSEPDSESESESEEEPPSKKKRAKANPEPVQSSFGKSHRNAKSKIKITSSKPQQSMFSNIPKNNFFAD